MQETTCPGCGLTLTVTDTPAKVGYFNCSPECWVVWSEIIAAEYGSFILFRQVHQLTVDAYAVQHAGGPHPDKSVGVHLSGLHLVLEQGRQPATVAPLLQRLAGTIDVWPHFSPPEDRGPLTVLEVSPSGSAETHITSVRAWAKSVWQAWSMHHTGVADLVARYL